jgi:acetyl esterase/lipase
VIKIKVEIITLIDKGYAIASVNYSLSTTAQFPAQIHDLKASIRFLRSKAVDYGYAAKKIAIIERSAGGHLAALTGVTNGHKELEGKLGGNLNESSDIQAIVTFFGPTNFMSILKQSTPNGLSVRVPSLKLLLGDLPKNKVELAKLASPVEHIEKSDPPAMIIHGDQDIQVPINQSHELHAKYKENKLQSILRIVHGKGHGGEDFFSYKLLEEVDVFLKSVLK